MFVLNLLFKKPSKEAEKAMHDALKHPHVTPGIAPEILNAQEMVKSITQHQHAQIVNSGNSAIMAVMNALDGPFILPDQGGWIGFKRIAEFLGKEIITLETEWGIISPEKLELLLDNLVQVPSALFLTSFAAYTAEQPVRELFELCHENDMILVEDASGSVGDPEKRLCNGNHAHIIIGSTGSPKIVNVGNGGFVSTNDKAILEKSQLLYKMLKADSVTCAGIQAEMKLAPYNLDKTVNACNFLKKNLGTVFHKNKRGITVILPSENPRQDSRNLRKHLHTDGKGIITTCPQYNRLMEKAVCIEIKNLNTDCLTKDTLKQIVEFVDNTLF